MSAHDTPEVGSGETVGDRRCNCGYGGYHEPLNPLCEQNMNTHASPDPVQPADAGEGLSEYDLTPDERGTIMSGRVNGSPVGVVAAACHVFAAREASWAEKYAAVVGERDALRETNDLLGTEHIRLEEAYGVQGDLLHDAEAALATARGLRDSLSDEVNALTIALATALREKAEDRARVEAVEALADEWAEEGPSLVRNAHDGSNVTEGLALERCATDLRAALAIPTATGNE